MLQLSAMVLLDEFSNEASRVMPYLNTEMVICGNFMSVVKTYWGVTHSRCTLQCQLLNQEYLIRPARGMFFGQLLHRALGGLAPIGSKKAVRGGTIKKSATG